MNMENKGYIVVYDYVVLVVEFMYPAWDRNFPSKFRKYVYRVVDRIDGVSLEYYALIRSPRVFYSKVLMRRVVHKRSDGAIVVLRLSPMVREEYLKDIVEVIKEKLIEYMDRKYRKWYKQGYNREIKTIIGEEWI